MVGIEMTILVACGIALLRVAEASICRLVEASLTLGLEWALYVTGGHEGLGRNRKFLRRRSLGSTTC